MIEAVGEAIIRCDPQAVFAFVTDLNQYRQADHKIGRVLEQRREANRFLMRHDGTLRGIPGPAVSLEMWFEAPCSICYRALPTWTSRLILSFEGAFEVTPFGDAVRVVHTQRFSFHWPWRLVAEPYLRGWLIGDVRAEMERMKTLLERPLRPDRNGV